MIIFGELTLFKGENFKPYLEKVLQLLFIVSKMAFNISPDVNEDIVDFSKNLKYALIQAFTYIEFSFNDEKEKVKLKEILKK